MQVMFVEVTDMMLRKSLSMAKSAKKYDAWKGAQVTYSACNDSRSGLLVHLSISHAPSASLFGAQHTG